MDTMSAAAAKTEDKPAATGEREQDHDIAASEEVRQALKEAGSFKEN